MKPFLIPVVLFFLLAANGCVKEKIEPPRPDTPEMAVARTAIDKTTTALLSGKWKVGMCSNAGLVVTQQFEPYHFTFATNGNLTAADKNIVIPGKWVVAYIDSKVRVSFTFASQYNFGGLSGDWTMQEYTDSELKMENLMTKGDLLTMDKE